MKTDNTTPGTDPSKQYEGTTSPKNPSLQLVIWTITGVIVILAGGFFLFYSVSPYS